MGPAWSVSPRVAVTRQAPPPSLWVTEGYCHPHRAFLPIISWEGGLVHPILQMMKLRPRADGQLAGSHTAVK